VFRLAGGPGDLFLKHGEGAVAAAIVDEAVRLRWLQGRIPCAPLHAFAAEGDAAWLLSGALPGRSGDGWVEADPASLPRIVDAFADFLRRLHAIDSADCPFRAEAAVRIADARRRVAAAMVDEDDFDDDHLGWSATAMLAEVERLAPAARASVVTHGDFSLGNLILDEQMRVTGCIDVGRVGVADPYQDIAIFWQNLGDHGPAIQRRFLDAIGIDEPDPERLRFHCCLDELF
jgi:aminoglycoside 3'-phosphotransferase I